MIWKSQYHFPLARGHQEGRLILAMLMPAWLAGAARHEHAPPRPQRNARGAETAPQGGARWASRPPLAGPRGMTAAARPPPPRGAGGAASPGAAGGRPMRAP